MLIAGIYMPLAGFDSPVFYRGFRFQYYQAGRKVWVPDERSVWRIAAVKGVGDDERFYVVDAASKEAGEIQVPSRVERPSSRPANERVQRST